mmetsp:Transcript_9269/g.17371  ORF Transcript_9269/g.17371 Transcript_9269/m.17371 type:complete len:373 (+) Transcript_9269:802-1920(+)
MLGDFAILPIKLVHGVHVFSDEADRDGQNPEGAVIAKLANGILGGGVEVLNGTGDAIVRNGMRISNSSLLELLDDEVDGLNDFAGVGVAPVLNIRGRDALGSEQNVSAVKVVELLDLSLNHVGGGLDKGGAGGKTTDNGSRELLQVGIGGELILNRVEDGTSGGNGVLGEHGEDHKLGHAVSLDLLEGLFNERMPIAHANVYLCIHVTLGLKSLRQRCSLVLAETEKGRRTTEVGKALSGVSRMNTGKKISNLTLESASAAGKTDKVRIAKNIIEKRLNIFKAIGTSNVKENNTKLFGLHGGKSLTGFSTTQRFAAERRKRRRRRSKELDRTLGSNNLGANRLPGNQTIRIVYRTGHRDSLLRIMSRNRTRG